MDRKASIAFMGEARKTPAELQGFLNFRAGLEARELKGDENVAIMRIEGTDSHHVLFLEKGTTLKEIEKSLGEIEAVLDPKARQRLERALKQG
jgi:hypothetical protein